MRRFAPLLTVFVAFSAQVLAFCPHASLAGLSDEQLAKIIPTLQARPPAPPPNPPVDTSAKLVADAQHPFVPPGPNDIRGPCPGLNTLANHGYIPHNGVASPSELIQGVMDGFNMGIDVAEFLVYMAHLSDGNLVTDLLSIGKSTNLTGENPKEAPPAGGLNMHGTFEGDSSMTRSDFYWGDNYSFNETLFQEMFSSSIVGFTPAQAAIYRYKRWQQGIATNPEFSYTDVRFAAAYAESVFTYTFFPKTFLGIPAPVPSLDKNTARSFFQEGRFPAGFYRRSIPATLVEIGPEIVALQAASPYIWPGRNVGRVNNYVRDETSPINDIVYCKLYQNFVNKIVVQKLYPNVTTPALIRALQVNLHSMWRSLRLLDLACPELHPYGRIQSEDFLVQSETPMMMDDA